MTDFNNHRLLVIKDNFAQAQVIIIIIYGMFVHENNDVYLYSFLGVRERRTVSSPDQMESQLMMKEISLLQTQETIEFK